MGQPLQNTDRIRRGRRGKVFLDQCSYLFHVMQTANVANQFYDIAQVGAGFLENSLQVGNNQFALRLEVIWSRSSPRHRLRFGPRKRSVWLHPPLRRSANTG